MTLLFEELTSGGLVLRQRLAGSSNGAWLAELVDTGQRCVYKPQAAERPLWDFPTGSLGRREVLAAEFAEALGWDILPATVWRAEAPLGPGMCQEWVESVADEAPAIGLFRAGDLPPDWQVVASGEAADGRALFLGHAQEPGLVQMALFDAIVNNADRKGGHVLRRADGRLVGVDHGLTWHAEPKLRTVLWGWAGEPLPAPARQDAEHACAVLEHFLARHVRTATDWRLSEQEVVAARHRARDLLSVGTFPLPTANWPALPWPPM